MENESMFIFKRNVKQTISGADDFVERKCLSMDNASLVRHYLKHVLNPSEEWGDLFEIADPLRLSKLKGKEFYDKFYDEFIKTGNTKDDFIKALDDVEGYFRFEKEYDRL